GSRTRSLARPLARALRGGAGRRRPHHVYCSIRRYEGVTNVAEAGRKAKDGFIPIVSKLPGFLGWSLVDAGNGVMISTSIFENKAAAEESDRRAAEWSKANMKDISPNPPKIMAGEVLATAGRMKAAA